MWVLWYTLELQGAWCHLIYRYELQAMGLKLPPTACTAVAKLRFWTPLPDNFISYQVLKLGIWSRYYRTYLTGLTGSHCAISCSVDVVFDSKTKIYCRAVLYTFCYRCLNLGLDERITFLHFVDVCCIGLHETCDVHVSPTLRIFLLVRFCTIAWPSTRLSAWSEWHNPMSSIWSITLHMCIFSFV